MRKLSASPSRITCYRTRIKIGLTLCLILLCSLFFSGTRAQNFSNLQGKQLTLVNGEDIVTAGLSRLFGGKIDGRIERVTVTDDRERRLAIKVAYSGLAEMRIVGEVQSSDKRTQRQVKSNALSLSNGPAEVELVFDLDSRLPEGTALESAFLTLSVNKIGKTAGLIKVYALPKRWQMAIRPENLVIQVKPRAEGSAASLPLTESTSPPVPTRSIAMTGVRSDIGYRPMPTPAPGAARVDTMRISRRTEPAVQALRTSANLSSLSTFQYGLARVGSESAPARGPSATPIRLLETFRSSVDISGNQLIKLSPMVYQDQNPASGIFYFIPQAYHVYWDPQESYAMKFLYGEATTDGEAGEVLMSAVMDAKVSNLDRQFAERLLRSYARNHSGVVFKELRQLPIDEAPKVSLAGDLAHQYNIPPEKIVVHSISDVLGQIKVSWVTDPSTKQFMKLALTEDVGINGTVTFKPSGDGLRSVEIPVEIKLADAATFGDQLWRRGERLRNQTPYPMRLKYLHAMLLIGDTPTIYSWNLEDTAVPPQAQVEIDPSSIPEWVAARAVRMWIDYRPVKDCAPCDELVFEGITNGVGDVASSRITFHTITPLADTRAYEITVRVRSRFFDPRSRDLREKPTVILNADNHDFNVGPIYAPARSTGDTGASEPLFEYFIELTMPDGNTYRSTSWTPGDGLRVLIGKAQLERALGSLPPMPSSPAPESTPSPVSTPTPLPSFFYARRGR